MFRNLVLKKYNPIPLFIRYGEINNFNISLQNDLNKSKNPIHKNNVIKKYELQIIKNIFENNTKISTNKLIQNNLFFYVGMISAPILIFIDYSIISSLGISFWNSYLGILPTILIGNSNIMSLYLLVLSMSKKYTKSIIRYNILMLQEIQKYK